MRDLGSDYLFLASASTNELTELTTEFTELTTELITEFTELITELTKLTEFTEFIDF